MQYKYKTCSCAIPHAFTMSRSPNHLYNENSNSNSSIASNLYHKTKLRFPRKLFSNASTDTLASNKSSSSLSSLHPVEILQQSYTIESTLPRNKKKSSSSSVSLKRFFKRTQSSSSLPLETSPLSNPPITIDQLLDKSKIVRKGKVGQGASGTVSIAQKGSELLAIKIFKYPAEKTSKNRQSFAKKIITEFCVGSTLHHTNIIKTFDLLQEENNELFIILMEYAPYDFFNVVMSGLMDRPEIFCFFKQIILGVHYLHSMGIAHRDLKLDNCVITSSGILKIIDFGSASIFQTPDDPNLYKSYGIVGSDPYLAPELLLGLNYDPRPVDVWSIAIIFYCMLLKRFPWRAPNLKYNSFRLFCEEPDEPTDLNKGPYKILKLLPRESRRLIARMMELNPKNRILMNDIVQDNWFKSIEHCHVDSSTKEVVSLHQHRLVTEDELNELQKLENLHIAEKNGKNSST